MPKPAVKAPVSREALLSAAARLIAERGFRDTKVSDIVAAAGMTQAAFYLYFPSKDAIFAALCERFATLAASVAEDARPTAGPHSVHDVLAAFRRTAEMSFRFVEAEPDLYRVVMASPMGRRILDATVQQLAAHIEESKQLGYCRADLSADLWAEILTGAIIRLTERYILTGERGSAQLADEFISATAFGSLGEPFPTNTQGAGQ